MLYLDALKLGAHGVVGGGADIYPRLFRALYDAFQDGDIGTATRLQRVIDDFGEKIYGLTGRPTSVFATIKAALAVQNLCQPFMAPPLTACTPDQLAAVRAVVMDMVNNLELKESLRVH